MAAEAKRAGLTTDAWYQSQLPVFESEQEQVRKTARRERDAANRLRINERAKATYATRRHAMKESVAKIMREDAAKRVQNSTVTKERVQLKKRRKVDAASTIQRFWRQALSRRAMDSDTIPEIVAASM